MSAINPSTTESTENTSPKMQLDAFLTEYKGLRDEVLTIHGQVHQLSVYSLASIAGLATLVVTLMNSGNVELLASVLLFLPLPFTAMLFSLVGQVHAMTNIGQYILSHIETGVNSILRSSSGSLPVSNVLTWETYQYTEAGTVNRWIAEVLWVGGQVVLILLPLLGSLIAYCFVVTEADVTVRNWWVMVLVLDIVLVVMALLAAISLIVRRGLLRKEWKQGTSY